MATYIPNAEQATEPVESRTVESAALEFRTLKGSVNARIDALQADVAAVIPARNEAVAAAEAATDAAEAAEAAQLDIQTNWGDKLAAADASADAAAESATASEQQASAAGISAGQAGASATAAAASAATATAASESAYVNADVYASTAAGLAAVALGEQFQVVSADGLSLLRYRHDAGPVATPVWPGMPTTNLLRIQPIEADGLICFVWEKPGGGYKLLAQFRESDGAFMPQKMVIPASSPIADDEGTSLVDRLVDLDAQVLSSLAFWGDSFMTGTYGGATYPQQVAAALSRTHYNGGIGGQTSTQIVARLGSLPARLTLTGNSIPASGSVVVASISTRLLSTPATTNVTRTISGVLAGVPGVLTCVESADGDASDAYSFARTTAGSAVFCAPDTPFIADQQYRKWTTVIGIGRNNVGALSEILGHVAGAVQYLGHRNFVVVGVTNASTEPSGSAGHTNVIALNRALAEIYTDRFIDIRGYLIHQGLAAASITPTAQDTADIAADVPPSSLRSDTLHMNAAANVLIKNLVVAAINYKGF